MIDSRTVVDAHVQVPRLATLKPAWRPAGKFVFGTGWPGVPGTRSSARELGLRGRGVLAPGHVNYLPTTSCRQRMLPSLSVNQAAFSSPSVATWSTVRMSPASKSWN